ncbi:SLOG family protein [Deltaproteobacteria bacterium OttesenSCG-928-K17]|nr:SLOG family protein [Deltaproteobacteria bacterium OttesenSCG-928-K17]
MGKQKTACFSGYRPEKFAFILHQGNKAYLTLEKSIENAILQAVDDGYSSFICGAAKGFDLVAGSLVVALRESWAELADLNLVAVLPFERHGFSSEPWRTLHKMVLGGASEVVTLASKYHPQAYHDRNRYMVDHSSRLICYYDGQRGGTAYTVKYAGENGLIIVNVAKPKLESGGTSNIPPL